jgi:hypothetical protein
VAKIATIRLLQWYRFDLYKWWDRKVSILRNFLERESKGLHDSNKEQWEEEGSGGVCLKTEVGSALQTIKKEKNENNIRP